MPKAGADDPIRDAHAAIVQAIADLKAIGVPVPMALHRACHALAWALREPAPVLPFKRPGGAPPVTKAQRERVRRHAAVVAIAQRPTVSEDGSVERHYHCQSAASAHDRGHGCAQAQPTHAT